MTVASSDIVSPLRWRHFACLFLSVADVYVGAPSSNPCPECQWRFVKISRRRRDTPWGRYIIHGMRDVWTFVSTASHKARWFVYARPDMQWLVDPRVVLASMARWNAAADRSLAFVPDSEAYWGVNDRFAICTRRAADVYFTRAALLPAHAGNTETLLAAALKAGKVAVRWLPTLGTLPCCASGRECHARGGSGVCVRLWVNASEILRRRVRNAAARGTTLHVKYIFEAQAAAQNAEAVLKRVSGLARCGSADCDRPRNPAAPHHCVPRMGLCLQPVPPTITWRALWRGNSSSFYRWLDPPPWRSAGLD